MLRTRLIAVCPALLLAWSAPRIALGAEYYVSTTGSDSNPGTRALPFKTIKKGVSAATSPGDIVYLRGGTYGGGWDNQLNPETSGTSGNPITFSAYPGELPILDGSAIEGSACGVEPTSTAVHDIRIVGLVAKNWGTSGFSNGYDNPSSNIEFIHCIADNNGVNGIAFYKAENVTVDGCISAHNGAVDPSWSSGITLYAATGTNRIQGNVSFENIDVSTYKSDGSGFILDEGSTGATFINNIAFRNGGSCIRLTKSSGGKLINNTCVLNGQDSNVQFNDEIYVSDSTSATGASLINNVALPSGGKQALGGGQTIGNVSNNLWLTAGGASPFVSTTGALDFHAAEGATQLIDAGSASSAPSDDIGFDPKCITSATGLGHWWTYAPDYAYIESIGGVTACFRKGTRPVGSAVDIGAYESGATVAADCSAAGDCDDSDVCTTDTCGASGVCINNATEGCCTADTDCVDSDECTVDTCDTAANQCVNTVDPECGQSVSGDWAIDEDTGYVTVCNWGGFAWTASGPEETGVNDTLSSIEETGDLCYMGTVAAYDNYGGFAMVGVNIAQESGEDTVAENVAPGGDGLNISLTRNAEATLRVQIQDDLGGDDAAHRWCVELEPGSSGGYFPWSDFNTECWGSDGVAYAGEPINVIAIMVAGHDTDEVAFDFCLNQFSPSGVECTVRTEGTAGAGGVGAESSGGTGGTGTDAAGGTGAATTGATGSGATGTTDCAVGLTACGNECVDLTSSPTHCGVCGTVCSSGQVCVNGSCGSACPTSLALCGDVCVDFSSSATNCGSCGNACSPGMFCSEGVCSAQCGVGLSQCGQSCVDLQSNLFNCGTCGVACLAGQTCTAGQCVGTPTGGSLTTPMTTGTGGTTGATVTGGVPGMATQTSESGCSCSAPGSSGSRWEGLFGVLFGLATLRRRRSVRR